MTASTFVLTSLESGRVLGFGLVCPQVRNCGVKAANIERIDRRFLTVQQWRSVEVETGPGLDAGPLPADSAIVQAFGLTKGTTVRYSHQIDIDARPEDMASALDTHLRSQSR